MEKSCASYFVSLPPLIVLYLYRFSLHAAPLSPLIVLNLSIFPLHFPLMYKSRVWTMQALTDRTQLR